MYTGAIVALATPFREGQVDEEALRRLASWLLEEGIDGLVPAGTTGEASTLTIQEWERVVRAVVEEAGGRVPVIAGTGTNCTRTTIERTRRARELGVDAALVVTPYYNKPTQSGLLAHYQAVDREGGLPIVAYNVPSRTGVSMTADTAAALARLPQVKALKEATGDLRLAADILARVGQDLTLLSGDDLTALPFWAVGGRGSISVLGNVVPGELARMWDAFAAGRIEEAQRAHLRLLPLAEALFTEPNPVPLKAALSMLGRAQDELRLPLVPAGAATRQALGQAMGDLGLEVNL